MREKLRFLSVGVLFSLFALVMYNCSGVNQGWIKGVEPVEFAEIIANKDSVIIIDVQSDMLGDIIISESIAYPIKDDMAAKELVDKYKTDKMYAIYDNNGSLTSVAAAHLAKQGAKVYHLHGGLMNWIDDDQAIMVMPMPNVMTGAIVTTKSEMMKDTTMMHKIKHNMKNLPHDSRIKMMRRHAKMDKKESKKNNHNK